MKVSNLKGFFSSLGSSGSSLQAISESKVCLTLILPSLYCDLSGILVSAFLSVEARDLITRVRRLKLWSPKMHNSCSWILIAVSIVKSFLS